MRIAHHTLEVSTPRRGIFSIHREIERWLASQSPQEGLLTALIQHTSASLLIQENADPDVREDLERFFARLVRDGDSLFTHTAEGPDDMPAHIRAALTQTQLSLPVLRGRMALGTWQGIYLYEHRHAPHRRRVVLQYLGT